MNGADIIGGILWGMAMAMPPQYYPPPRPYYPPPQQYQPAPPMVAYRSEFNCTPPLTAESNPVVQILVTLAFDYQNQFLSIKVLHRFRNGSIINRWSQYPNASVSFQEGIYGWKGNYNRDPSWVMAGGMFMNGNVLSYREKQWKDQTPSFDVTAQCSQYAGPIVFNGG